MTYFNTARSRLLFAAIVLVFIARAATLEITDLIDPTESRYASIAAHMVSSGNWLVPMLDLPTGVEPYLGKPPLHFWLTAISYKLFGQEEWSSRLPSLIAAMFIVGAVVRFGRQVWNLETGLLAGLVTICTPFFLLFSGGSITDITLTACISWSVVSSFLFFSATDSSQKKTHACIVAVSVALGFLTKGPVAIVLSALPIFVFLTLKGTLSRLKEIPWLLITLIFFVIISPWFILSEIENPGFLKYFFWNENIARYLVKDYGDRYGSGHVYPRGMAILMMILVTMPWAVILLGRVFKQGWQSTRASMASDDGYLFSVIWGTSAALFFCLVRQLHAAYLVPAVPGIALAVVISLRDVRASILGDRKIFFVVALFGFVLIGVSSFASSYYFAIIESVLFLIFALVALQAMQRRNMGGLPSLAFSLALLSILAVFVYTPYLNSNRSAEGLLKHIATVSRGKTLRVGVTSSNLYSPYWLSMARSEEFPEKMTVQYVNPVEKLRGRLDHLLVRREDLKILAGEIRTNFKLVCSFGKWNWMTTRKGVLKKPLATLCPFDSPA